MELAALIPWVVKASIFLTVFALGLQARVEDILALRHSPGRLGRSLLAMNVVMPVVAVALARIFDLQPAVKIALVTLALSPVPPILPKKALKASGDSPLVLGLLAVSGLFAVVFIPLALEVVERVFGIPMHVSPGQVATIILLTVLVPLGAGLALKRFAPNFAGRIATPLSRAATVSLLVAFVPILFTAWPAMAALIGNGTLLAFAAFVVAGLAVGHLLGGPERGDRTVLALSTASRHPGVALTIASANFPEQKLVLPAVLLYLIAGGVLSLPYLKWRRRV